MWEGKVLPRTDEVLSHADVGWGACDGDVAHCRTVCGPGNFDLGTRHLANLIDLTALSANDAAYELRDRETDGWGANNIWTLKV